MKTKYILFLIILSLSTNVFSQIKPSLSIGKSTDNKLTKDKSAQIVGTYPDNDTISDSWLLDGYIEFKLSNQKRNFAVGLLGEIHKNNLISKEQDVRQYGISVEKDFLFNTEKQDYDGNKIKSVHTRIITSSALKSSKDFIKDKKEFIGNIGLSISVERGGKLRFLQTNTRLINIDKGLGKFLTFSHNHNFGLGYIGGDEDVLLGDVMFEIKLFPLSGIMNQIEQPEFFNISWNIIARKEFYGEAKRDINNLKTLSAGIKYVINKKSSFGISYGWQDGANPYTGTDNQSFQTLTANLRLVLGG